MCVIFYLPAGVNIKSDKLFNAVANNWHGYGIVLRDDEMKKTQVIKKFDAAGTDAKEVEKILRDNDDIGRYVHLRYATAGGLVIENSHPFTSYYSDDEEVYFMHNGTLSDYKPIARWSEGKQIMDADEKSDSYNFNEKVVAPMMLRVKGNINDEYSLQVIEKFWGVSSYSRGILVSKTEGHVLINKRDWKEVSGLSDSGEGTILCSNDDYFDTLKRGPILEERRKKEEEARQARLLEEREVASRASRKFPKEEQPITANTVLGRPDRKSLLDITSEYFEPQYQLGKEFAGIIKDINALTDEEIELFSMMSAKEAEGFVKELPNDAVALILMLTKTNAGLVRRNKVMAGKMADMKKVEEQKKVA